ncbi:iron ABC transporter permease [Crocosphaera sp. UHCC 0190]|uniref:ABC transporter permease n=1 Tax=Crocosphaera sp. UHCC 0190 TaxID=3110246 RepID=UPI002B219CCE|nr:iron ABC transporter permease [Crocosphaera sp. UHCC 0190]MEA5508774.1 iron ABC transporter permease [Crocosphaera sp. UHCC 0190]
MTESKPVSLTPKSRLSRFSLNSWTALVIIIAALIATPILFVVSSLFTNAQAVWQHLAATVLTDYIINSLLLMFGVGVGVLMMGVSTAWLVTLCRFWGCSWFEWLLLLPLSAPAYLLAYTYTNMLDYYGPVQITLRQWFGWSNVNDYWFPDIRSLWGAIIMLILVLYPYVYLLARTAFLEQSICTLEASRSLGCSPWQSFFKVALPLARPAIMAGLALALMETLNDFGTVQYFGVNTFTTGIYSTWFGLGERQAAAQLAAFLMLFIVGLITLELWSRRQARYYQTSSPQLHLPRYQLNSWRAIIAWFVCFLPFFGGFLVPAIYLIHLVIANATDALANNFWQLASHSLIVAVITAIAGLLLALIMAYGQRLQNNLFMKISIRIAALGYAIPGSVIAVGILIPVGKLDNAIANFIQHTFNLKIGLLISGTIVALIYAYLVRFLPVAFGAVESSLGKIKPSLDDAARSLGSTPSNILVKVHTPLMTGGMLTSIMLVFVDVMKELPATLVIRPFNFDTLAIRVYQYASDERLPEAAAPALAIVLVGMIPVIFLSWQLAKSRRMD